MAFRGRGRGRGQGRGLIRYARQDESAIYPDVELPDIHSVSQEKLLVTWNWKLMKHWESSPYRLKENILKASENQDVDIERFSDRTKQRNGIYSDSIMDILQLHTHNFPQELIRGRLRPRKKRVKWNPNADLQRLDIFEKLEQKGEGEDGKPETDENEDEDEVEEEEEEEMSEGDYEQNRDFDDDEDDYNMNDDDNDEPCY